MKIFQFVLLMLLAGTSVSRAAETNSLPVQHRFLFVIQTSSSMQRSTNAAHRALQEMIYSGLNGEMRDGDTFGIWTYQNELQTGKFPLQRWRAENRKPLTMLLTEFLRAQQYEKSARFNKVLPQLSTIVKSSPSLTIIWITDGRRSISGMGFDKEINALHRKYADDLQEAQLPFVTALLARDGKIADYAVNSSLGPWKIPHLDRPEPVKPKPMPATTNLVAKTNAAPAKPKKIIEPIVIKGPARETNSLPPVAPTPTNSIAPTNAISTKSISATNSASIPTNAVSSIPVATNAEILKVELSQTNAQSLTPKTNPPTQTNDAKTDASAESIEDNPPAVKTSDTPNHPLVPPVKIVAQAEPKIVRRTLLAPLFFLVAGSIVLAILVFRFRRKPDASLISQSMNKDRE